MKTYPFFKSDDKPFSQLLGLCVMLLFGFLLAVGIQLLLSYDIREPNGIRMALVNQGISQLVMFFVPAFLFVLLFQGDVFSNLKMKCRGWQWVRALTGGVILLLLMPLLDWVTFWNDSWNLGSLENSLRLVSENSKQLVEQMLSLTGVGDLILQIIVVALLPAICEEMFFRGAMQQIFSRWFRNHHVAIIVTSLIFSLAHGDVYGFVPRFLLGMLLGYLFVLSGSLVVNICVHFINNVLVVVAYYLYHTNQLAFAPDTPLQIPAVTTLCCTVGAALLFIIYFVRKKEK